MKWLSDRVVAARGWTVVGEKPPFPKAVIVGAPHTSNWDFFLFLAVIHRLGFDARFLIKDSFMIGPLGWLMRRLGAIPVDRSSHHDLVRSAAAAFEASDEMYLVIAPEGTRGVAEAWKSGFWRIAEAADVPVVMAFIDGETKTTGLGPSAAIHGDPESWIEMASDFYEDKRGVNPKNRTPVVL